MPGPKEGRKEGEKEREMKDGRKVRGNKERKEYCMKRKEGVLHERMADTILEGRRNEGREGRGGTKLACSSSWKQTANTASYGIASRQGRKGSTGGIK
jgi:hypothetical protein